MTKNADAKLVARFATTKELETWDSLIAKNPAGGDLFNVQALAATKRPRGWKPRHIVFEKGDDFESAVLVLELRAPLGGKLWYIARGPSVDNQEALYEHLLALKTFAKIATKNVFAVTLEPPIRIADDTAPPPLEERIKALDVRERPAIQVSVLNTAIVYDLERSEDELLASFDKKGRNMIRRAIRDGIEAVKTPTDENTFTNMHRLMRLVGGGKADLRLRPKAYLEDFWREFTDSGLGQFYTIYNADGEAAVMSYMIQIGDRAFYKDGGSDRTKVSPGMSNFLIWQMILDAKEAGAKQIDLMGIAPSWAKSTADDGAYGLGLFKLSFARERTDHIGAFDLVLKPTQYALWKKVGERVMSRLHRKKFNDIGLY